MIWTIYKKFQLSFAQSVNRFIYTLRKIKPIGKLISEEWYVRSDIKKIIGIFSIIYSALADIFGKLFYFCVVICAPALIFSGMLQWGRQHFTGMVTWSFFVMNCLLGAFVNSHITKAGDEQAYLFLNLMRFNPREHYLTEILWEYGRQLIYYGLFLGILMLKVCHVSAIQYFWLMAVYICFRFIGEAVRLKINDRFGIPFQKKNRTAAGYYYLYNSLMVVAAYGTYPLLFFLKEGSRKVEFFLTGNVVILLVILALSVVAAVVSVWYLWHYPDYVLVARRMCNMQGLLQTEMAVEETKKNAYELNDKEVDEKELQARLYQEKQGYDYLNAIFFKRHKRLVHNVVIIKTAIIGLLFLAATVALVIANFMMPEKEFMVMSDSVWQGVNSFVPIMVFMMYLASSGQNLTQAMFYNCDIFLLKHGYYRAPEAILKGFAIRLRYMIRAELPTVSVLCGGIVVDTLLLRQQAHMIQMLSIVCCVCILTVFYSIVFLCMYYIFQPFTEGGAKTGLGYSFCSGAIYMVSYMCLQIRTVPSYFTGLVMGVTAGMLVAGFVMVWRVAPKTFRLK